MYKLITVCLVAGLTTGCATHGANYAPLVDSKGVSQAALASDLAECQQYATQRADAATGAVIGALFGAVLMASLGGNRYDRRAGAILGGLGAAGAANETQETITKRCLAGRGYNVLN